MVTADHIIFCTHYPFVNMPGFYFMRMHQERSYAIALEHAGKLKDLYYGIDQGALSLRPTEEYLIVSGGSHRTGHNCCSSASYCPPVLARQPGSRGLERPGLYAAGRCSLYRPFFTAAA